MKKLLICTGMMMVCGVHAQHKDPAEEHQVKRSDVEEVIIRGNRLETPFSEVTRDIQVITQKQIQAMPVKSLNEVLSYISGVDIRQRGPFGTQTDIAVDGGTSEQTLVLINGVKMIDSQTAHNMMNIPVPLTAIDHIEVIRGAAARLYGINALTGAVNIVTRKGTQPSITADIQAGSSFLPKDEREGSGIYGGSAAEFSALFGNERQSQLFSFSRSDYNGQRYNSAAVNTRLFYSGSYDISAGHSIRAMAGHSRSSFGANGFYAAPGDVNAEELVNSSVFSLSSEHTFGRFTLSPRISDRYGEDDYRYFKHDLSKARSRHYTNAVMLELNSTLKTAAGMLGFGVESRLETISSSNIGEHKRNNHGAYAEFRTGWGTQLKGTLGLYGNYNTDFGFQVYPGADIAYYIGNAWKLSAGIGSGQRIPSFTDLYLNQRPGNIGNPLLKPENAWNYEADIQYRKEDFQFKAGYFYRDITGFIDWVRDDASQPYAPLNLGNNKMNGFFGRIQQDFNGNGQTHFGYMVGYTHLRPSIESPAEKQSKYTLESLKHQLTAGINFGSGDFSMEIRNRWMKREIGDAYNIADIRLGYSFHDFQIYSDVTNIFNAEYREAGAVPMPTRWFSVGLKYDWKGTSQ